MKNDGKLHEECAVFGASLHRKEAVGITYNGLLSLQHRGQEGAGIAGVCRNDIFCHKNTGLISEVFSRETLEKFPKCQVAIGHTRYSTTGSNTVENVGPFVIEFLTGRLATAHNGNITNAKALREKLMQCGLHFRASSDSEVASALIAYCITQKKNLIEGVKQAAQLLQGAFSLVVANGEGKLIAIRDPSGFRPLCIGQSELGIAFASESCALETCGFRFLRDVEPGEMVIAEHGRLTSESIRFAEENDGEHGLCVFEYVYFARSDSVLDGLSVYEARYNMGIALAEEYPVEADIVCGVPDSGLGAACGYSAYSHIPLVSGFVKNRYIGRSFIYPSQQERNSAVNLKLNPLSANVKGKRVVLVDDSIVRGTTSRKIIQSLKEAGALEVHMRVSSPPFVHACHYGTDVDSEENLIANQMSMEEVCREIRADSLGYIGIKGLKKACAKSKRIFCTACFTGEDSFSQAKKDVFE